MIPSSVAAEVEDALRDFLATRIRPSNPELATIVDDFLADRANFLKGPYLSVSLPFQHADGRGEPFPEIPLGFVPYRHQSEAFERLAAGRSTVVATGTGSGKTECFLYPLLDWCRRQAGKRGIKAILIYPMNALATDQAGRIARLVDGTDSLRGKVTAGIYIGQDRPSSDERMTGTRIIASRQTLVERPPDILLTNYKMLDYLLSRPRDQRLWRENGPDTLRWLVVDELHTFDGAQGTDLACLIRRLKARLQVSDDKLVCVGTSATLGTGAGPELVEYVSDVFGCAFAADSIVGESRQSIDEFLRGALIGSFLRPPPDISEIVDRSRFRAPEDYLRAQYELFFQERPGDDFLSDASKVRLGERLRTHAAFVNLMRILDGHPKPVDEVAAKLGAVLDRCSREAALGILNGLCALVSTARTLDRTGDSETVRPFLQVSHHLWVRELARMVCSVLDPPPQDATPPVDAAPAAPEDSNGSPSEGAPSAPAAIEPAAQAPGPQPRRHRLRAWDDVGPDEDSVYLPLVQCPQCRFTGWGALLESSGDRVRRDPRLFYNHFFGGRTDVLYLFPDDGAIRARDKAAALCGACGAFRLGDAPRRCAECGADRIVRVFVPNAVKEKTVRNEKRTHLSYDCPCCQAVDVLLVVGSRATSLLSVALGQTFASRHNDDRKVIAFSDNVQDAAHRAGFIAHRTWRRVRRTSIARALPSGRGTPLADLPRLVVEAWSRPGVSPAAPTEERFVEQFIAPDRTWLREFKEFQESGKLPPSSRLLGLVKERLEWEVLGEFGFASGAADSLERSGAAAIGPSLPALEAACEAAVPKLREEIEGLSVVDIKRARWLALGLLRRMKDRGAFWSDRVKAIKRYLDSGCSGWSLHRNLALQEYGPAMPRPRFPSAAGVADTADGIEPLAGTGLGTWYQQWIKAALRSESSPLKGYSTAVVLNVMLDCLREQGLIRRERAGNSLVWAIDPRACVVTTQTAALRCRNSQIELLVPAAEAPLWIGAPCMELGVRDSYGSTGEARPSWAGARFRGSEAHRLIAEEHTALLTRERRERIERRFSAEESLPWDPNMLSATSTLELGIDIGSLSTVALCSMPPTQANYLQRIGRAGRRDGNAFTVTLATARAHDLFFYEEPLKMLDGAVAPPGVFLNASAVLERQLTAFCLDNWAADCGDPDAVPRKVGFVFDAVRDRSDGAFPYTFFRYAAQHAERLNRDFEGLFEDDLTEDSKQHLRRFLKGGSADGRTLSLRILGRIEEVNRELDSLRSETDRLQRKIRELKNGPSDEGTEKDIVEYARDRRGLLKLRSEMRNRDTFGFLTDEGLIPNYAFPEASVTLRSVILRRPSSGTAGQSLPPAADEDFEVFEYLRPAAAALSELAPSSRFYAGGHHVEIDRIDLDLTVTEQWRLCPSCTHCRCIDAGDKDETCPRCGDPMWSDAGQAKTMLNLRLVHASTPAQRAQIRDDRDEREAQYFARHLVADFDPAAERRAFAVRPPAIPFGFEYASRTTFREMNFGRGSATGQPTRFAGREMPREGFRVCKLCGKVQPAHAGAAAEHAISCRRHDRRIYAALPNSSGFGNADDRREADPEILECLYLYREFESESVRMLIPAVEEEGDGPVVHSFVAAVELGLREKFGGRIDHLRVMTSQIPEEGSQAQRRFLTLYDTVPGGTGYLKQLTQTAGQIAEVFRQAYGRLRACDCDDGCYRCVFAYRRSREMDTTSKRVAIAVLGDILAAADDLQPIDDLETIKVQGLLESKLEARFVLALEKRASGGADAALRPDIVRGGSGFIFRIGSETWNIEPQVNLNESHGVLVASCPDFLLRPAKEAAGKRPVAVFLDGFQYHKRTVGEDSAKRMALVRAGYLQWSLTWSDMEIAFGGTPEAGDLLRGDRDGEAGNRMRPLQEKLDAMWSMGPLRASLREASFPLLLRYLADPDAERWQRAVFAEILRLFDPGTMREASFRGALSRSVTDTLPPQVAEALADLGPECFLAGRGGRLRSGPEGFDLFAALTEAAIKRGDIVEAFVAIHLDDEDPQRGGFQKTWNGVLRLFNLIQFLPNSWWSTRTGMKAGIYPEFPAFDEAAVPPSDDWAEAIDLAEPWAKGLLRGLARSGAPVPEIGFELVGREGRVEAEAEVAWQDARVAVLGSDQSALEKAFLAAGWRVWKAGADPNAVESSIRDSDAPTA